MRITKIGLIIVLALSVASLSYAAMAENSNVKPMAAKAADGGRTPWVKTADVKGTSDKIDRGVRRLLFGWTEIPKSIVRTTNESKNPFWGLTGGTLIGVSKAFPKTVSGGADLVGVPIANPSKPPISPEGFNIQGKSSTK